MDAARRILRLSPATIALLWVASSGMVRSAEAGMLSGPCCGPGPSPMICCAGRPSGDCCCLSPAAFAPRASTASRGAPSGSGARSAPGWGSRPLAGPCCCLRQGTDLPVLPRGDRLEDLRRLDATAVSPLPEGGAGIAAEVPAGHRGPDGPLGRPIYLRNAHLRF